MHADTYPGVAHKPLAPSLPPSPPAATSSAPRDASGDPDSACLDAVAGLPLRSARPLALHLHIPSFDDMPVPVFGGLPTYLAYLKREAAMRAALFAGMNEVGQLRFDGVSPASLSAAQVDSLMTHLRRHFRFVADEAGEFEVRADARGTSPERIRLLRRLGFNCISLDVGDDGAAPARVRGVAAAARAAGFRSLRVVFAYGLPGQGVDLLRRMLATIIGAGPSRVALQLHGGATPAGAIAQRMRRHCIDQLGAAGYAGIGGDSFALPGDDLAQARRQAAARPSVSGIALQAAPRVVGCGVSAVGIVGALRSLNVAAPGDYYALLDRHELPVAGGAHQMVAA